jgi:hypothetical protein
VKLTATELAYVHVQRLYITKKCAGCGALTEVQTMWVRTMGARQNITGCVDLKVRAAYPALSRSDLANSLLGHRP